MALLHQVRPLYNPPNVYLVTAYEEYSGASGSKTVRSKETDIATLAPSGGLDCAETSFLSSAFTLLGDHRYTSPTSAIVTRQAEVGGGGIYYATNPLDSPTSVTITCEATPVHLSLTGNGVALARFDSAGNAIAIESEGPAAIGSTRVSMTGHFALGLTAATQLIVPPFGAGTIDLRGFTGLQGTITNAVDFRDGQTIDCGSTHGTTIAVDGKTGFDIRIVAQPNVQKEFTTWLRNSIEVRRD